jgi:hypothetical protein
MKIGIHYNHTERGPGKVVHNLREGFKLSGIEYVENSEGEINVILQDCGRLYGDLSNCLIGPNICTLPIDNRIVMDHSKYKKILVPSEWVKNLYSRWLPVEKIQVWPVGIDIDLFGDFSNKEKSIDFLVYFKRRERSELNIILDYLNFKKLSYHIVEYGNYTESNFIKILENSKRGIVIGNSESQGIAIQEMMSSNLPLLIWDIKKWKDRGEENSCTATSVPYWDNSCGEIFYAAEEIEKTYNLFINRSYSPRGFIIKNLNLEKTLGFIK